MHSFPIIRLLQYIQDLEVYIIMGIAKHPMTSFILQIVMAKLTSYWAGYVLISLQGIYENNNWENYLILCVHITFKHECLLDNLINWFSFPGMSKMYQGLNKSLIMGEMKKSDAFHCKGGGNVLHMTTKIEALLLPLYPYRQGFYVV